MHNAKRRTRVVQKRSKAFQIVLYKAADLSSSKYKQVHERIMVKQGTLFLEEVLKCFILVHEGRQKHHKPPIRTSPFRRRMSCSRRLHYPHNCGTCRRRWHQATQPRRCQEGRVPDHFAWCTGRKRTGKQKHPRPCQPDPKGISTGGSQCLCTGLVPIYKE